MVTPQQASRYLEDVSEKKHFKLHLGTNIRNLQELAELVDIMPETTFQHHVNEARNEFADWIRYTVKDRELAQLIQNAKSRKEMAKRIRDRILYLEAKTAEGSPETHHLLWHGARDFATGIVVGVLIGLVIAAMVM